MMQNNSVEQTTLLKKILNVVSSDYYKPKLLFLSKSIFGVYVALIVTNTYFSSFFAEKFVANIKVLTSGTNFKLTDFAHDAENVDAYQRTIMNRNIFNTAGAIPFEDTDEGSAENEEKFFAQAQCAPATEKLPVELVGILYTGNPKTSLVTLKDPQVASADIYRQGDKILDYPNYQLSKITGPNSAEFRNGRKKICLTLNHGDGTTIVREIGSSGKPVGPVTQPSMTDPSEAPISLGSDYVKSQIGSGFSNIIKTSRIVPVINEGKMEGFRIFAIQDGSLFDKIGVKNGDVISKVNSTDLNDPSQGFQIYDAFQNEDKIELSIKRGGSMVTRKVVVK